MNLYNSRRSKLISIVGYGTFITRNLWKDKANVEVCQVKNFTRIFPGSSWFPYALHSNHSFKALKFDVTKQELNALDIIEGVNEGLFERVRTEILLRNTTKSSAFIYIPTNVTIISKKLSLEMDRRDRWKEEIKKNKEVILKYPELLL